MMGSALMITGLIVAYLAGFMTALALMGVQYMRYRQRAPKD